MIDLTATKTVKIGGNEYVIGKVQRKVMLMYLAALTDCESNEEFASCIYGYIPFFLVGATVDGDKMPAPEMEADNRTTVRVADFQWIADNLPGLDAKNLINKCVDYNSVAEKDKKKHA